jgi:N-acetylmuramoyl-L-alanine amidase
MRPSRRRLLGWPLVALAAPATLAAAQAVAPHILGVRLGVDSGRTRLVIDTRSPLGETSTLNDPVARRLTLSFDGRTAASTSGHGVGLIRRWAVSPGPADGRTTVTLDLVAPIQILAAFALPPREDGGPWRRVIDLVPAPAQRRIVVDAGHGGTDSGARGRIAQEKDVTLLAAHTLARILETRGGYAVTLTRSDDRFVPLIERQRSARALGADLFLSLHADASTDTSVQGASAYTLSDHGARRALAQVPFAPPPELLTIRNEDESLRDLLLDLRQRGMRNRSAAFADQLLRHVAQDAPLLRRSHREAGFMVLLGLDAPAALLEMGFITNPDDERRLTDPVRQAQLMGQVCSAIDTHFSARERLQIAD